MFYLIKGIKRIITDYVIGSELSKLILELENKKNILDNDKIFEEYDSKTTIYSNQNLVVTYRNTLKEKLTITETSIQISTEPCTETITETSTETKSETSTESESSNDSETSNNNKNTKVKLTVNKKKSKYYNKFRKISIQQNKTICFNCGRDTHKQNECTETIDIYGTLLV